MGGGGLFWTDSSLKSGPITRTAVASDYGDPSKNPGFATGWLDAESKKNQSHRHGWAYQGLWLPSHTDTAGHTKAFDYPVIQTRLDIPRPLITQSHRHGWTYQGLWLPSHTDTAGHTKVFDYPVTQTRLDIPRPLITQSHRHGWTYQDLWLPSHTDTAGHTKVWDYFSVGTNGKLYLHTYTCLCYLITAYLYVPIYYIHTSSPVDLQNRFWLFAPFVFFFIIY